MISIGKTTDGAVDTAPPQAIEDALHPRPIRVSVAPVAGGWAVVHDLDPLPLMFLSGGRAEAQALRIVRLANIMGSLAQLEIVRPGRRVQASPEPNSAAITRPGSASFRKRRT